MFKSECLKKPNLCQLSIPVQSVNTIIYNTPEDTISKDNVIILIENGLSNASIAADHKASIKAKSKALSKSLAKNKFDLVDATNNLEKNILLERINVIEKNLENFIDSNMVETNIVENNIKETNEYKNFIETNTLETNTLENNIYKNIKETNEYNTFDAYCDPNGSADYLLPSEAFLAGNIRVFLRNGVYYETSDIIIPNLGSIVGESGSSTTINFSNKSNSIKLLDEEFVNSIGTITLLNNSKIVNGIDTTFTDIKFGLHININNIYYKIYKVIDDTKLEIEESYTGIDLIDYNYFLHSINSGIIIKNIIITNSTSYGIYMNYCKFFIIDSVTMFNNTHNLLIKNSNKGVLKNIISRTSKTSVLLDNCNYISCSVVNFYNNLSAGIIIKNKCESIVINMCNSTFNVNGIEIIESCNDCKLLNNYLQNNTNNGVYIDKTCNNNTITSSTISNNINGITMYGNNTIINSTILLYNNIGVNVKGKSCIITNNIIKNNKLHGINVDPESFNNIINNNIYDNSFL
jgi:parallel beta-helix repeat protein